MPFDPVQDSYADSGQREDLPAALASLGIAVLSIELLERHKVEQVRCHPPGWSYRHAAGLQVAQSIGFVCALVAFGLFTALDSPAGAFGVMGAAIALMLLSMLLPTRGPAYWSERSDNHLATIHPELRALAQNLRHALPGVRFRVGELRQDRVLLDPYLLAEFRGMRAVLGIWDGDRLIAKAERRRPPQDAGDRIRIEY